MAKGLGRDELQRLYTQLAPAVHRRARLLLGRDADAWDVVQEVFEKMLLMGDKFRGEAQPMTWAWRITTNLCLNKIRDASRRRALLAENAPVRQEESGTAPEDRAAVAALIASLPDELREIAVYYFVDEMNQDEIAEIVGVSRRTVGNRLDEFRVAARAALGDDTPKRVVR